MVKRIHYCWFGKGEKPEIIKKCIQSWKKFCPEYEITEWNEENFDIHCCRYVEEAYTAKKWAFVSDYCRFYVLYHYGGIYLDTDVEIIKSIHDLPSTFVGFERETEVASGLIRGAEKGDLVCKEMMNSYERSTFLNEDGTYNHDTVCIRETNILVSHGLCLNGEKQVVCGTTVFPTEYFNPKGGDYGKDKITENTRTIHHYAASWKSPIDRKLMAYKVKYGAKKGKILFILQHPILSIKKFFLKR